MTRQALCIMVGILFVATLSSVAAQQIKTNQPSSSVKLPADVCQAVQQYVAKIDAARSMNEASKREQTYAQAQKQLEPVLQRHKQMAIADMGSEYAKLTETVVKTDSTDPKLPKLLDERLALRAKLLDHCDE